MSGLSGKIALGRAGQPEDIAEVMAFLASDDGGCVTANRSTAAAAAAVSGDEVPAILAQFPRQPFHRSRRIAEPVIGRAFARPGGDAPQDAVSDPHGEERVFARLEP